MWSNGSLCTGDNAAASVVIAAVSGNYSTPAGVSASCNQSRQRKASLICRVDGPGQFQNETTS